MNPDLQKKLEENLQEYRVLEKDVAESYKWPKEKLAKFGHGQELVKHIAQGLHDANLIQITENYYLPLNEKICQQAAESLMAEFLQELED